MIEFIEKKIFIEKKVFIKSAVLGIILKKTIKLKIKGLRYFKLFFFQINIVVL